MTTLRSRFASVAVALAVTALAGCTNFEAPTDQIYNPARGVTDRSSSVDVLNVLVVSAEDGAGTVVATLVNNDTESDDRLLGVTVAGTEATISTASEGDVIPASGLANLGVTGAVRARSESIVAGRFVEITFTFAVGEAVTVQAPVVPHDGDYADVPVSGGN